DRAKSELRDPAPVGAFAQKICKAIPPSRVHPFQCLSPRPLQLPILRLPRGSDLRPSRPPLKGRHHDVEECRRRLLQLQSAQGRSASRRGPHVAGADALSTNRQRSAPERPPVSAQLSARKLDGLSLLGLGSGAVTRLCAREKSVVGQVEFRLATAFLRKPPLAATTESEN